jgi:hypothetical protein
VKLSCKNLCGTYGSFEDFSMQDLVAPTSTRAQCSNGSSHGTIGVQPALRRTGTDNQYACISLYEGSFRTTCHTERIQYIDHDQPPHDRCRFLASSLSSESRYAPLFITRSSFAPPRCPHITRSRTSPTSLRIRVKGISLAACVQKGVNFLSLIPTKSRISATVALTQLSSSS